MEALRRLERAMHAVLRGEVAPEAAASDLGVDPRRLTIYRDFVYGHIEKIVTRMYPRVRALAGDAWDGWVADYFRQVPSASWEINACAEPFCAFLDARSGAGGDVDPFIVALARFEWEEFAVYVSPAATEVAGATPETPAVNPTASLMSFDFPVVPFVVDHPDAEGLASDTPRPQRLASPQLTLMFRRAIDRIGYYVATDDLLFALKVAYEGLDVAAAAAAAGQPLQAARAAMAHAREIGLLVPSDE